jgi:hypothetical protein
VEHNNYYGYKETTSLGGRTPAAVTACVIRKIACLGMMRAMHSLPGKLQS